MSILLAEALAWHALGFTPVPAAADGSKRPGVPSWREWQTTQPDAATVVQLFAGVDVDGLGLICGGPAALEMLELEGRAVAEGLLPRLAAACTELGISDVWQRLDAGYVEETPSGGVHWYYRISDGPARPNTKLASRPATADELEASPQRVRVLIETRGQGGFSVIAPSGGRTHPTGADWMVLRGSRDTLPSLTVAERDALYAAAASLDQTPTTATQPRGASAPPIGQSEDGRPGDDFNQNGTWDFLADAGWQVAQRFPGGRLGWTRPGKSVRDGISATTGGAADGVDRLYVFSTSTEFDTETPYTRFGAYTLLVHGGDWAEATRELRRKGYGGELPDAPALTFAPAPWEIQTTTSLLPLAQVEVIETPPPVPITEFERVLAEELRRTQAREIAREMIARGGDRRLMPYDLARLRAEIPGAIAAPPAEPFDLDTLGAVLKRPADPPMRIERILPWAAAMLLIAQRKAGKTTLELNLARSLLTGEDFLGTFSVLPIDGAVALLNYEVGARQIATWADEHGVDRERLILVNLRGRRNPLADPADSSRLAAELRARQVETVIVDPFGRAYTGQSQNDAGEVGGWLQALDRFVRSEVGALDLILTAHAGWNGERTRGSSALEDWADVLVTITRDNDEEDETGIAARYLRAEGRDVEIPEDRLSFEVDTRTLSLTHSGGRRKGKTLKKQTNLSGPALELIKASPGMGYKDLVRRLRDIVGPVRDTDVQATLRYLIDNALAHRQEAVPGAAKPIYPGPEPLTFGATE